MPDFSLSGLVSSYAFQILLPELFVLTGILVGIVQSITTKAKYVWFTSALFVSLALAQLVLFQLPGLLTENSSKALIAQDILGGAFYFDSLSVFFRIMVYFVTLLICLAASSYMKKFESSAEYFPILLTASLGAGFLTASNDMLSFFVSLETLTLSSILISSFARKSQASNESGIKFLISSAVATAMLLTSMSMIYGLTGATGFQEIATSLYSLCASGMISMPVQILVGTLMVGAIGFKLSAVPFHNWAPDVYTGAPTTTTLFLSVVSKTAAFGLAIRVFDRVLASNLIAHTDLITNVLAVMAILSIIVGNYIGVSQIINRASVKKLLAYSSIAQSGYLMIGLVVLQQSSLSMLVLYLSIYALMNTGVFLAAILFEQETGSEEIYDMAGWINVKPFATIAGSICLINLAGLPFIPAGFIAKFFLFSSAYSSGLQFMNMDLGKVLAVVGLLGSVIALFYYLYLVKIMVVDETSVKLKSMAPAKAADNPGLLTILEGKALPAAITVSVVLLTYVGIFKMSLFEKIAYGVIGGIGI